MQGTLKTCTGYLSVRTNAHGKRVWTVLCRNQPLCADTENLRDVLTIARQTFGRSTLAVWDGDKGEFTSEMVADPNY
jgi:hypothetical protein